jgi:hypothetical protein
MEKKPRARPHFRIKSLTSAWLDSIVPSAGQRPTCTMDASATMPTAMRSPFAKRTAAGTSGSAWRTT